MFCEFRKIIKVGHSFCVTLPKKYMTHLKLQEKDYCIMKLTGEKIELKKWLQEVKQTEGKL
jgi:antitoxin component of MazEF toxin-antitoxin module